METNGVNYYKGVLLCSRPNESPSIPKQKPFCGRVTPHDSLGLVPTKKFDQHEVKKRVLPVLNNHKKWLEGFKKKINNQKQSEQQQKQKEQEKLQKIKQEGAKRRQNFKRSASGETYQATKIEDNQATSFKEPNHSGKQSNLIGEQNKLNQARAGGDRQGHSEEEVDQLLDFFENTDIQNFLEDNEVNKMLKDLKERIQSMKLSGGKDEDWRKKQIERYRQEKQKGNKDGEDKKDDILSRISRNSEARSAASQKTVERVEQLERKKQEKEWDKNTVTEKKSQAASVEQQIAKNVADEVLRNYPALKHHSNQSIRRLLEKQAREQMKD